MPLSVPRLGLPPRSLPPMLPVFPSIKRHNRQPIQPKKAATKPSHILKKDSAMFCFMVLVNLAAELGLLGHISFKGGAGDCVDSLEHSGKQQLSCTHWKLHRFLSLLVQAFCRLDLL